MVSGFWVKAGNTLKSRVWRFFWHRGGPVGTLDWTLQAITFDPLGSFHYSRLFWNSEDALFKSIEASDDRKHAQKTTPNIPLHLVLPPPPPLLAKPLHTKRRPVFQGLELWDETVLG